MIKSMRIIKKYPNRRLYDTAVSSYVTLEDVRRLVIQNIDFVVVDARSKTDITHDILLQIITSREDEHSSILSCEFLKNLIRSYDIDTSSEVLSKALDKLISDYLTNALVEDHKNLNGEEAVIGEQAPLSNKHLDTVER